MQPWHSLLLIIITLIAFGAGFYYDQIEKNTAIAYEDSLVIAREQITQKQDSNISSEIQSSSILETSSAWAETKIIINLPSNNSHFLYLHQEAMKGDVFLASIIKTLGKNPTAKEVIFSPFINNIFTEPESAIMRSLYSFEQDIEVPNHLLLVVRGHSGKASSLLSTVIMETYKRELKNESTDNPLLTKLSKQRLEIRILEENQLRLAEQIEEENINSSGQTIEEIALRSEMMQITNEINSHVAALKEIEKIHRSKKDSIEYLSIHSLANFGNVQELLNNIDQLKRMLVNEALEPILKKVVAKNLEQLATSLSQELAKGIELIKELSRSALKRKIELQKRLVNLEIKKNDIHSLHPSYKLFKSVKKQLDEKKAIFSSEFEKWRQAKEGITFQKAL